MTDLNNQDKHLNTTDENYKLRDANDAHPQARELAQPLHEEFIKRRYL